jgi:hypothetical protein
MAGWRVHDMKIILLCQNGLEFDEPKADALKKEMTKLWSHYSNWSTRLPTYQATHNITGLSFNTLDPLQRKWS